MADGRVFTPNSDEFRGRVRTYEQNVKFNLKHVSGDPEHDLLEQLKEQLTNVFSNFKPLDFVSISFKAGSMKDAAETRFGHFESLDLSQITQQILDMDQSNKLDIRQTNIPVTVQYVGVPAGNGRCDQIGQTEKEISDYVKSLKSVVKITADDGNCFVRCVVYLIFLREHCHNREHRAALKSFAHYVTTQARSNFNPIRKKANDLLNQMRRELLDEFRISSGHTLSYQDYDRVGAVLEVPNGSWRLNSYRLRIVTHDRTNVYTHQCSVSDTIDILHSSHHYQPITNHFAFFAQASAPENRIGPDHCVACNIYTERKIHLCQTTCRYCRSLNMDPVCEAGNVTVTCSGCFADFPTDQCAAAHRDNGMCLVKKKCPTCERVYRGNKHLCGGRKCYTCGLDYVSNNHSGTECYIRGLCREALQIEDNRNAIFGFMDLETAAVPREKPDGTKYETLIPVMACLHTVCNQCWNGEEETLCNYCCRHKKIFKTLGSDIDCVEQLVRFLRNEDGSGITSHILDKRSLPKRITIFAHNMKRFDGQLLLETLCSRGFAAQDIIMTGNSIMQATIGENMRLVDSINFLIMPLAKLPEAYQLQSIEKRFPHAATFRALRNGWDGQWPSLEDFYHHRLAVDDQTKLEQWYDSVDKTQPYPFWETMERYITDDVTVLKQAVMKFRQEFINLIGTDPLTRNITLAGAVTEGLRVTQIAPSNTSLSSGIPIFPYHSYDSYGKVSIKSRIWLLWLKKIYPKLEFEVSDSRNGLKYDGYDPETQTVFEFYGCLWHGCTSCFRPSTREDLIAANRPLDLNDLRLKHETAKKKRSESGFAVVELWEHEFDQRVTEDPLFRAHYDKVYDGVRMSLKTCHDDVRKALMGGRVESLTLWSEAGTGRIMWKDIQSLYPSVLYREEFPSCHPDFIFENFDWSLGSYFGLVECTILPPKQMRFAVLPYRTDKLCFPLCRSCVEQENDFSCYHSDSQREIRGLWTTEELKLALEKGYIIRRIFVVLNHRHRVRKANNPLSRYMTLLLRNKIKFSGRGKKTDEELNKYLDELRAEYDIDLKPEDLVDNPAARQVAKLMCNSCWGRLGIRMDRTHTELVDTYSKLLEILYDPQRTVKSIVCVGGVLRVSTEEKSGFIRTPCYSSLMTAVFTTSHARITLFRFMDKLGDRLLYVDTDSVIYRLAAGEEDPIPDGAHLGDMTNELAKYGEGAYIKRFGSSGEKCYTAEIVKGDGNLTHIVKHKGVRANGDTYTKLSFATMWASIRKHCQNTDERNRAHDLIAVITAQQEHTPTQAGADMLRDLDMCLLEIMTRPRASISVDQHQIRPNKLFELEASTMQKTWRITFNKRRLLEGGDSVPRGYVDFAEEGERPASPVDLYENGNVNRKKASDETLANWSEIELNELEEENTFSHSFVCRMLLLITLRDEQYGMRRSKMLRSLSELGRDFSMLENYDLVYVPHWCEGSWILYTFDTQNVTITITDPVSQRGHTDSCAPQRALEEFIDNSNGLGHTYPIIRLTDVPQLSHRGDSGLYVILYAEAVSRDLDPREVDQGKVTAFRDSLSTSFSDMNQGFATLTSFSHTYNIRLP